MECGSAESSTAMTSSVFALLRLPSRRRQPPVLWSEQKDVDLANAVAAATTTDADDRDSIDWSSVAVELHESEIECLNRWTLLVARRHPLHRNVVGGVDGRCEQILSAVSRHAYDWSKVSAEMRLNELVCKQLYMSARRLQQQQAGSASGIISSPSVPTTAALQSRLMELPPFALSPDTDTDDAKSKMMSTTDITAAGASCTLSTTWR